MRFVSFFLAAILSAALLFVLAWPQPFGKPLPPVGKFFSPFGGFWKNAAQGDVFTLDGSAFEQLKAPVTVVFDERLVPHVFAENETDAVFAQGYVTARYRLWQMDFATRAAAGRLSEVVGEKALDRDRGQRRKGMLMAARNAVAAWEKSPEEMALVEAYTNGVNAYIQSLAPADYPLEFKLLDYAPEPWTPLHSALMMKNMAETLCFRSDDLAAYNSLQMWGREMFDFLHPSYNPKQSPIIPAGTPWNFKPIEARPDSIPSPIMMGDLLPYPLLPQSPSGIGSNNWAVSGKKTASGHPILSNDPHLTLSLPSIWFEMQIHAPEYQAYGVTIPGLPGIVIGFNDQQAWGVTNVGHDVVDWYRIAWMDDEKTRYLLDNEQQTVEVAEEVIEVKGWKEPHIEKVKHTVWGPIVYEDPDSPYRDLAMHWIAHEVQEKMDFYELGAFYRLGQAKTHQQYTEALRNFENPAQNFVMANNTGDIAIRVNGKFPIKTRDQGRFVQDGSSSANDWAGFIPMDQIPQILNPERGFVSSANQASTDQTYPYYYNSEGFDDYRGRIINRTLEEKNGMTVKDMMALQNDNRSILAEEALPLLLKLLDRNGLSPEERTWVGWLEKWDLHFNAGEKAPMVFSEWLRQTHRRAFDEIYVLEDSIPLLKPENWRLLELLEQAPDHIIFDQKGTPAKETAAQIVTAALHDVAEEWAAKFSESDYNWATHKSTDIMHLARIPAFSKMDLNVGGYGDAPNAIKGTTGPSWRVVVELGPEVKAWGIYPGGQSGHPGSRYYDNRILPWMKGEYDELYIMKRPDERSKPELFGVVFSKK
ncbi:MAG TPA: penicillin acylase family protein [Saprospiraceae bacterium]|nr:penicillin acylase family protein [Saprospiraceae bacterium]